jgi:hypothetical protein
MKIYHASLHQDITKFRPLTHFGARDSALAAAAAKYFVNKNFVQKAPAWLYEVELDCQDSEFLDCEDVGTPTARAILNGMKASLENDDQIKLKAIMEVFKEFQNKKVPEETINSVALEYIEHFLTKLKKSVFRYKNDVEAAGMTSYCLFDCSNLKLCSQTLINFDELLKGYELLNTCRQSHLIHPDQWQPPITEYVHR